MDARTKLNFMGNERLSFWWWLKLALNAFLVLCVLRQGLQGMTPEGVRGTLGQVLVGLGAGINLYHYRILRLAAGPLQRPAKLVTTGGLLPYLRHPMYFGEAILVVGLVIIGGSLLMAFVAAVSLTAMYLLCHAEDKAMAHRFPDTFSAWAKHTGTRSHSGRFPL